MHVHTPRRTPVRTLIAALLGALLVAAGLGSAPAGAATGPVFGPEPAPADWASPMGMTHPVTVGGNYVPLAMGCGDPDPERRILWYGTGAATDTLWSDLVLPETGIPTYTSTAVRVDGTFQPFVGDFDGDGCDDIFWYGPGTATDVIWYFGTDGTHTSVPVRVDGTFTPVVGNWNPTTPADEIFWYAPGTAPDRMWAFLGTRTTPTSATGPQVNGTYTPVVTGSRDTILWIGAGSAPDSEWIGVEWDRPTPGGAVPLQVPGPATLQAATVGGEAVLRSTAGTGRKYMVAVTTRPTGSPSYTPTGTVGELSGAPSSPVMTSSTHRAGFGVLYGPGDAPDLILEPTRTKDAKTSSVDPGTFAPCAVQAGLVKCWGGVGPALIGGPANTAYRTATPVAVGGITGATAVAVGEQFACALLSVGTVKCWGIDTQGQRGDGAATTSPFAPPTTVSGLTGVVQITAGRRFACARLATGEVRCWGQETDGQLGNGGLIVGTATVPVAVRQPAAEGSGNLGSIASIDAGLNHVCALTTGRLVRCWGDDTSEQLGNGAGATDSGLPVAVALVSDAREVTAGGAHSCARIGAGGLRCWGSDTAGQTGDGGTVVDGATVALPSVVVGISNAISVSAGSAHTCAVLATSDMRCWGDNQAGQLGDGTTVVNRSSPAVVRTASGGVLSVRSVTTGVYTTCAQNALSAVYCWGYNIYGQTGNHYMGLSDGTPGIVRNLDGSRFTLIPVT